MGNTIGFGLCGLGLSVAAAAAMAQAADLDFGDLKRSNGVFAKKVVASQYQYTEDIDESSAEELLDAKSYAKDNAMLIEVSVLGTTKQFWRLSDEATRISRKLARTLSRHHSVGKCLADPLLVSHVWIGSTARSVKLRGVSFTSEGFSIERARDDYKHLSNVLMELISTSGGDTAKLPPDYLEFLRLLRSNTLGMEDEFLIVNNAALLPMKNRTDVFKMLYDIFLTKKTAKTKKMVANIPYKNSWLDTATANKKINQWVVKVKNKYKRTPLDFLRLNRNVICHLRQYGDEDIEEVLYYEWPKLLMFMEEMLHLEGELEGTDIENKFG